MKVVFSPLLIFCSTFLNAQTWVQEAPPPSPVGLDGPMWFSIGGKLYVGGGYNSSSGCQTGFYEYDPRTNTWTTKAPIPIGLASYGFVINGKGYTVCGITANGTIVPNVYMYDPVLDQWTRKRDFTEGTMRQNHTCFSLNGYGYMFGGFIGGSPPNNVLEEMWQYNPTLDTFIKMTSCPGPPGRNGPAAVVINNQAYVGMGCTSNAGTFYRDFYLFDPVSNTYTLKDSIPTGRSSVANFTWGGKGYVGLGVGPGPLYLNDFWIYDPVANTWTADNNYGGGVRAHPFSDTVAGLPYVGCGNTSSTFTLDNWRWGCILPVYVGHDTTLCAGTSISLRDTFSRDTLLHATYLWSTGDTTPAITVSTAGSYWLQVTIDSCSGRDTINVTFTTPPATFSLGNDTTYNGNFTRTLSTGSSTTRWSTGVTGSSITVNVSGTYWAVDSNRCGAVRDTIILNQVGPVQTWIQKASLPAASTGLYPFEFSIGGKLYVGDGLNSGSIYTSLYQYDPATNIWTPKTSAPVGVYGGAFFVLNGKGYIVSGETSSSFTNTVYMYDPVLDSWTQKNNIPTSLLARQNTIGFSLNGKGYLFGGFNSVTLNDMWEYDPGADSWTQKTSAPGPGRDGPTALVINNQAYVGLGSNSGGNTFYTDFYRFDPVANTYTQVANSPVGRNAPAHFTLGSIGYIGLGFTSATSPYVADDFTSYNPITNTWTGICNFQGPGRGWTFSDTINGQPYVGAGSTLTGNAYYTDLWTWGVCTLPVNLGRDTTLCVGSTVTLRDTFSNAKSLWSTGDTMASITVSSSGSYWCKSSA